MAKQRAKSRAKSDKGALIGIVIVAVVAGIALIFVLVNQINTRSVSLPASAYSQIPQSITSDGAPVLGNPDARITIMEFADFSCPHCADYHPVIKNLIEQYVRPGKARLIFRPETFVGQQFSEVAAQAALCAGKQNRFWEMHDALFQIQETRGYMAFNLDSIKSASDSLGLNTSQLLGCIERRETVPVLQSSYTLGQQLGVTGTPAVLYSTDGRTFNWWTDSTGTPVIPPYEAIAQTVEQFS